MKAASFQLIPCWTHTLTDYVTRMAWSPDGTAIAAASATGEVVLYSETGEAVVLQAADGHAINGLAFAADGRFLAAAGQSGKVTIWPVPAPAATINAAPILQRIHGNAWIDTLAWHPTHPYLAYGLGSEVLLWDVSADRAIAELAFQNSSVLHLAWHPTGQLLAASGHGGVKVWTAEDWSQAPTLIAVPGASLHCAWSTEGRYLGSGNLDRTLTVTEWDSPPPWLMQGFPGKVRQLSWSMPDTASGAPLVAAACMDGVTVWERAATETAGWKSRVLQHHRDRVNQIAFRPQSLLLASASEDGQIGLWQPGRDRPQTLAGFATGASQLAWHPGGEKLAAGSAAGEIRLWTVARRAQGFG